MYAQHLMREICATRNVAIELQRGVVAGNIAVKYNLNVDKK
jgi:hypothetical protein